MQQENIFHIHQDIIHKLEAQGLTCLRGANGVLHVYKKPKPVLITRIAAPESRIGLLGCQSEAQALVLASKVLTYTATKRPHPPSPISQGRVCTGSRLSKDISKRKLRKQKLSSSPLSI